MQRRLLAVLVATVAAAGIRLLALPPAGATGEILINGVQEGRFIDPFLRAAEPLVRRHGFQGDFAILVGLAGLADEATMCRHDCECRETLHSFGRLKALVSPLRGKVTRFGAGISQPETAWQVLHSEVEAGNPLLAEGLAGPTSLNLVVGCIPADRTVIFLQDGSRSQCSFNDWLRGSWSFSAARLGTTTLPGAKAEIDAIAKMVVRAREPRIEGGCAVRKDRTQNAVGLEAYSLWTEQVKEPGTAEASGSANPQAKGRRVAAWAEKRGMLAAFLRHAAKNQEGKTADQLKAAADSAQREVVQGLIPLSQTCPAGPTAEGGKEQLDSSTQQRQVQLMQRASGFQHQCLQKLEPIAYKHLGLTPKEQKVVALKAPKKPAKETKVVRNLLKSPKAEVRTLGALAASRTKDTSLAPDIAKGISSRDGTEARTSLAALKTVDPPNLKGMLRQQLDAVKQAQESGAEARDELEIGADSIQNQLQIALEDVERREEMRYVTGRSPLAWLFTKQTLFIVLGLAVVGLGLVAWRVAGPQRLSNAIDEPEALPPSGIPEEAARLERMMYKPPASGLLLTQVYPDQQGHKQGLRPGDILYRYAGETVANLDDLRRLAAPPLPHRRDVSARRDLRVVKTVVGPGPLGVNGVALEKGKPFWRRLLTREYEADYSGLANAGELWYRFTQNGRPVGFECRRWRWYNDEVEVTTFAGFAGEGGEQSVRAVQRMKAASRLTSTMSKFSSRGGNSVDANGHSNGGRWVVYMNGKAATRDIPDTALPSHALSTFVSTLPFERGRAYDIIRIDEWEFQPSYGCQVVCLGPEMVATDCGDQQAYRFEQNEYGLRQMAFWYNAQRQLARAEYAGLVAVLSTREQALADLPEAVLALANES